MIVLSLPFVWIGLSMTLRRLRSAAMPLWLGFLFFIPVLNIVFLVILSLVPAARHDAEPQQVTARQNSLIPSSMLGSAAVAVVFITAIGLPSVYIGVQTIGIYGWSVFV